MSFDKIIDYGKFDSDQIEELREIYKNCNSRLFLFLANHPEIGSDHLWEISQLASDPKMLDEAMTGIIIQVLGIYMDHIKEENIPCCFERIRYGMYAIKNDLSYAYIEYLMCKPTIHEKNIKDIYECFMNNITLARISETIPVYSMYTPEQVTQICKALIDIQKGMYDDAFLSIIKFSMNSAHDMLLIRREAKIINDSLKKINTTSKTNKWARISIENADA